MPLFSIIIPHYTIPDLLMRCLKSIPVSEEIQVIVVDDNSLDADTYLERYPELSRPYLEFIRTTKGGGAGYARNIGLEHAKGKWLLFADADDFFLENMYDIIRSHVDSEADIIYYKVKNVMSDDIYKSIKNVDHLNKFVEEYIETGNDKYLRYQYGQPWCKMIRKELVDNYHLRFDEIQYGNDTFFSVFAGYYARLIEAVDSELYVYTYRPESLSSIYLSKPNELNERADAAFRIEKYFYQHNVSVELFTPFVWFLNIMLHQDRKLFRYYFFKFDEVYQSRLAGLRLLCQGKSIKFHIKLYLYSLLLLFGPKPYARDVRGQ